jgi:hypothetical protein
MLASDVSGDLLAAAGEAPPGAVRRLNEELALGYVTARLFECTFILVGIVAMLGVITLRNRFAGPSEGTVAYTLAAIKTGRFSSARAGSSAGVTG